MPVVHVNMLSGRSKEQKRAMAEEITEAVHKHSGAPKEVIIVTFNEMDNDSWAMAGTLHSDK